MKPPKCISKWQSIFGNLTCINEIFYKLPKCYERKSKNLHWNILHSAVFSEMRLQIMNKSDGICKVCETNNETLTHLFYECSHIQPIWQYAEGICELLFSKNVHLEMKDVFLCVQKHSSTLSNYEIFITNALILIFKWEIWKHRNTVKMIKETEKNICYTEMH